MPKPLENIRTSVSWRDALKYYIRLAALKVLEKVAADTSDQPALFAASGEHISNRIAAFGIYAPFEILGLKKLLESLEPGIKNKVMLDVGANIGNHSVSLAPHFHEVHAFEINPELVPILRHNTRHLSSCHVYAFGASDENGSIELEIDDKNLGKSAVVGAASSDTMKAQVRRLENVEEIRGMKICFVKIDVEGHEAEALAGMTAILSEQKPIVAFELHADQVKDGRSKPTEFLRNLGYSNFAALSIHPGKGQFLFGLLKRILFGMEVHLVELDPVNLKVKNVPMLIAY